VKRQTKLCEAFEEIGLKVRESFVIESQDRKESQYPVLVDVLEKDKVWQTERKKVVQGIDGLCFNHIVTKIEEVDHGVELTELKIAVINASGRLFDRLHPL